MGSRWLGMKVSFYFTSSATEFSLNSVLTMNSMNYLIYINHPKQHIFIVAIQRRAHTNFSIMLRS